MLIYAAQRKHNSAINNHILLPRNIASEARVCEEYEENKNRQGASACAEEEEEEELLLQ